MPTRAISCSRAQLTCATRSQVILITNLFKLVRSNDLAALHSPTVLPGIERIIESAAFPEIRAFAVEAKKAVEQSIEGAASPAVDHMTESLEDEKAAFKELLSLLEKETGEKPDEFFQVALHTVAFAISQLVRKRSFDDADWKAVYVAPYLANFIGKPAADALAVELRKRWMAIENVRLVWLVPLTFPEADCRPTHDRLVSRRRPPRRTTRRARSSATCRSRSRTEACCS